MALATSSTVAILWNGILAAALFLSLSQSGSFIPVNLYMLVSVMAGHTAFTRMPRGANSRADDFCQHFYMERGQIRKRMNVPRPAFVIQQPMVPALGLLPRVQETLTMHPLVISSCLQKMMSMWKAHLRLMSIRQSQSWGKVVKMSPSKIKPTCQHH